MIITMSMILFELSREFECTTGAAYFPDTRVARASVYTDSRRVVGGSREAVVLESSDGMCPPGVSDRLVIALGKKRGQVPDCAIFVTDDTDIRMVLAAVQNAISVFEEWADALTDLCFHSAGLEELVDQAHEYFENPITIIDQDYRILARTDDDVMQDYLWTSGGSSEGGVGDSRYVLPEREEAGFDEYLRDLRRYGNLYCYRTSTGKEMISQLVRSNGNSLVAVNVVRKNRAFADSDSCCLAFFAKTVASKMRAIDLTWTDTSGGYDALLQDVVRGNLSGHDEFKSRLAEMWIGLRPLFTVLSVQSFSGMLKYEQLCRIEEDLAVIIPDSKGVIDSRSLILFINHDGPLENELWRQVEKYACANSLVVGISDTRRDDCGLSDLVLESKISLRIAHKIGSKDSLIWYAKYRRYYLYEVCSEQSDWQRYLHPCVEKIRVFDETNGSSLLHTLVALVANSGNRTETARSLNIQRNTLHYRLNRINEVCDFDIAELNVFDDVSFSVNLMRYCRELD